MGKKAKREYPKKHLPGNYYAIKMLGVIPDKILPDGWIGVNHFSGAIVYMHRETRVVTWSRPYVISRETSLKKHNIPLMSIPCLHQKSGLPGYEEATALSATNEQDSPETIESSAKKIRLDNETVQLADTDGQILEVAGEDHSTCNGPSEEKAPQETGCSTTNNELNKTEVTENSTANSCPFSKRISDGSDMSVNQSLENVSETASVTNGANGSNTETSENQANVSPETRLTINGMDSSMVKISEDNVCPASNNNSTDVSNEEPMETSPLVTACPYSNSITSSPAVLNDEQIDSQSTANSCPASLQSSPSRENSVDPVQKEAGEDTEKFLTNSNSIIVYKRNEVKPDSSNEYEPGPNEVSPESLRNYLGKLFEVEKLSEGEQQKVLMTSENFKEHFRQYDAEHQNRKLGTENKTPFQILNEYCQRQVKSLPHVRKIERHSSHDFTVEIIIKNLKYGIAVGDTLKEAKHNCAVCTMNIFDCSVLGEEEPTGFLAVVDKIPANDKSVLSTIEEFAAMGGVKYPYEILVLLLDRNLSPDFDESEIEYTTEPIAEGRHKYCMKFKEYKAEGETDDVRQIKEVAAQALVTVLYPDFKNWGSFVRMVEVHQELVDAKNQANEAVPKLSRAGKGIITVLRQEMRKLAAAH